MAYANQNNSNQSENTSDQYKEFLEKLKPNNPQIIRPKKMNVKEFLKLVEEIYSYRFDYKSVPSSKKETSPPTSLQDAAARYLTIKLKTKSKVDQQGMDFLSSIEYHRQQSVEADLFYRFFTQHFGDQDLMFFLFERSLVEREMNMKFTQV